MRTRIRHDETGIALVSALLVLLLMSSLMVGFMAMAAADTRTRALSGSRTQAFYAAHAGLEQLTSDLGDLFSSNFAASCADVNALVVTPPELAGVTWEEPDGGSGYLINYDCADGAPVSQNETITSGPFQGFVGLATQYEMEVTARQLDGSEASLTRSLQTVAIPVFQFGMFSETDLSFFAGPAFNFGGRVHTNGNLFLAADPGPLTLSDRVTVVGEVVRAELSNQLSTSSSHSGETRVITSPGATRALTRSEGSVTGGVGTSLNEPTWTNRSTGTYNSNITNGRTGARRLELPLTSFGATPIDLIRRPVANEDTTAPNVLSQRFFSMASLRILLSDEAADISSLPTVVTSTPPLSLDTASLVTAGYVVDATHPPVATAAPSGTNGSRMNFGAAPAPSLHGGFIKIEMQNQAGTWTDVTLQILNYGISRRQFLAPAIGCAAAEPNPNAIIRIQSGRDSAATCFNGSLVSTNYWPLSLYDAREGLMRDGAPDTAPIRFGGIMHYVELDVENLTDWFEGTQPGGGSQGTQASDVTGFVVYFSDRRSNNNALGQETGEYGVEEVVNRSTGGAWSLAAGIPNDLFEAGEDLNGNTALEMYGATANLPGAMTAPYVANMRPWSVLDVGTANTADATDADVARANPPVFFRRALKLVNGGLGNIVAPGLTVASENPVYVQGNWNANAAGFGNPHVATAVIADAVTLLSNNFNDRTSFLEPHDVASRVAATTWYRLAIIAGKGLSFPGMAGTTNADYGTDGGAHNFFRLLENWNGQTLNYRGAIASMYTSRQAVGTYKCCADVYSAPTRAFVFDTDFLTPSLLPPRTPMFRDVNTTGFAQIIRPR